MSIVLRGLTKRVGKVLIVDQVSLEVTDGELFVLLGASGSGKSSILRMIAGLAWPNAGTIELNGRDVTSVPPQTRNVGFVFQNYSIFRHMTVAENIAFGMRIRRVPAAEREQRSDELLDLVGLGGLGARYADQLSGGQQQRVALARALAYHPNVLLLDEPFGALDVKIRGQLRRTLKEIQSRLQVTTILVTHDQEEAFELADRVAVIDKGRLVEVGHPEDLYHRPRTELVAKFIGGSNVLAGHLENGHVRVGRTRLPLRQVTDLSQVEGAAVRVLFRPEAVVLQEEAFSPDSGVQVLGTGRITERVFVGSLQRFRLELEDLQETPFVIAPTEFGQYKTSIEASAPSEFEPTQRYKSGQHLWIGLKDYHVLQTTGLKMLICSKMDESVATFGCSLAVNVGGAATLLSVVDSADLLPIARNHVEKVLQAWSGRLPRLTSRVRHGSIAEEILLEVQEGDYELVIFGHRGGVPPTRNARLNAALRQILEKLGLPVLVVQTPRWEFNRLLICSAVGEPGKADIVMGGRLASLTGAEATVLHVQGSYQSLDQRRRTERHLQEALVTLESFGVRGQSRVASEDPIRSIMKEAEVGDYDVIVIGAPAPRTSRLLRWRDVASEIVSATTRPVLMVPMVG
jgi:sulfate/thiosulfate transport system ATP-binding protein